LSHEYESLSFLGRLNLNGNAITVVPEIPQENLKTLDMANNSISSINEFKGHKNLKDFNLENNKLENLEGLSKMPALESLNLAGN